MSVRPKEEVTGVLVVLHSATITKPHCRNLGRRDYTSVIRIPGLEQQLKDAYRLFLPLCSKIFNMQTYPIMVPS